MKSDWINIHTHKPGKGINVVDPCLGEVVLPEEGMVYYSLGIHPVYIDAGAEKRLEEIREAAAGRKIIAIGEAGMDRNSPVGMEEQTEWFRRQAEIAGEFGLPLIIHGVRTIPELISVYKQCRSPQKWIIHGFNNRREVLADLLRHGFYISVGRQVMNEKSPVYGLLPEIPADRLFMETDNSDFGIAEIYRRVAERREIPEEDLQQLIRQNFERLFPV